MLKAFEPLASSVMRNNIVDSSNRKEAYEVFNAVGKAIVKAGKAGKGIGDLLRKLRNRPNKPDHAIKRLEEFRTQYPDCKRLFSAAACVKSIDAERFSTDLHSLEHIAPCMRPPIALHSIAFVADVIDYIRGSDKVHELPQFIAANEWCIKLQGPQFDWDVQAHSMGQIMESGMQKTFSGCASKASIDIVLTMLKRADTLLAVMVDDVPTDLDSGDYPRLKAMRALIAAATEDDKAGADKLSTELTDACNKDDSGGVYIVFVQSHAFDQLYRVCAASKKVAPHEKQSPTTRLHGLLDCMFVHCRQYELGDSADNVDLNTSKKSFGEALTDEVGKHDQTIIYEMVLNVFEAAVKWAES